MAERLCADGRMAMAGDSGGGGLDAWVWFDREERRGLELVEVIVNLRRYAEQLVLQADVQTAARAGRLILDHPPVAASSRAALGLRFPQADAGGRSGSEAA